MSLHKNDDSEGSSAEQRGVVSQARKCYKAVAAQVLALGRERLHVNTDV